MILQELSRYYQRLLEDPEASVPVENWSSEKAAWELRIAEDGRLMGVTPLTAGEGKDLRRFIVMQVPEHTSRTAGVLPFFLCDNAAYLLGLDEKRGEEKRACAAELHQAVLGGCDDEGARAVLAFFERDDALAVLDDDRRAELAAGGFAVFRLHGDRGYVHERSAVREAWRAHCAEPAGDAVVGQCAITGERAPMERLFPQVTGVPGAQSAGASLVSFNLDAFESYGKRQGYNASLSKEAAFNAGSALRYLFGDPGHRVRYGQTTVLFWTDRPAPAEEALMRLIMDGEDQLRGEPAEDNAEVKRIRETLEAIKDGRSPVGYDLETRFFVLGIAPNAARLAVRFFEVNTFGDIARHYGEYLRDIDMVGVRPRSLRGLLRQVAPLGEYDAVPSTLINSCMHALLTGERFPRALAQLLLTRMRADHGARNIWDVGERAALMKACLVRDERLAARGRNDDSKIEGSLKVALDTTNANQGYVLGRMFAIMEYTQRAAIGDANSTIRDRYIGAASSTPARAFGPLMRNFENHLAKLMKNQPGLGIYLERLFNDAVVLLPGGGEEVVPATLGANDQINFFVAYHQQKQELWKSRKDDGAEGGSEGASVADDSANNA